MVYRKFMDSFRDSCRGSFKASFLWFCQRYISGRKGSCLARYLECNRCYQGSSGVVGIVRVIGDSYVLCCELPGFRVCWGFVRGLFGFGQGLF